MNKYYILSILLAYLFSSCDTQSGKVKGTLCYPSEYIPAMKVYIKNQDTKKVYSLEAKQNQRAFLFKEIPAGKYVAYAYTLDETMTDGHDNSSKAGGGYTQFVPCGLSVDCSDHSLITFHVKNGETADGIEICDWYGAIIPKEAKNNP